MRNSQTQTRKEKRWEGEGEIIGISDKRDYVPSFIGRERCIGGEGKGNRKGEND